MSLAALALLAVVVQGSRPSPTGPALAAAPHPTVETTVVATPAPPLPPLPLPAPCSPASLDVRAGRVLFVGLPEVTRPDDPLVGEVLDVGVGGVLLTNANVVSEPQAQELVSTLRAGSRGPLLVAADEEPGRVRTLEVLTGFVPSARRLATERSADEVRTLGRATGGQLAGLGINVDFGPVADLDAGPWDGIIGDRSFSDDPAVATAYSLAYARGLWDTGVLPVVKHFPGHGRSLDDDHVTRPRVDAPLDQLLVTDVRPFARIVAAGAPAVMMSNVAYDALEPGVPASMSAAAYRLLRGLGFEGAAITDSIGMGAVNLEWDFGPAVVKAIAAGADGVLATDGWQARLMRDALVEAVRTGAVDEARLNEAASRMTALAGGDPLALTCRRAALPVLG